jgi:hypothetical protein
MEGKSHFRFINPKEIKKSFTYPIPIEEEDFLSMEKYLERISIDKGYVFTIEDFFRNPVDLKQPLIYFLELQPFYITSMTPRTSTPQEFTIKVKAKSGEYSLKVLPTKTVEQIKQALANMTGAPLAEIELYNNTEKLEDKKPIAFYDLSDGAILTYKTLDKGGAGMKFVDISNKDKGEIKQWSGNAPKFRIAEKGLCLEGKCLNQVCPAYGKMVVINKGFCTYDIVRHSHMNPCPLCKQPVSKEGMICAFNNCYYYYGGIQLTDKGPKEVMCDKAIYVGHHYLRFSPDIAGDPSWLNLKIITKDADYVFTQCCICLSPWNESSKRLLEMKCKHQVHRDCYTELMSASTDSSFSSSNSLDESTSMDCPYCQSSSLVAFAS